MSAVVSLYEAKTHLSRLVDRAAGGEEILITKNGVPSARLVPVEAKAEMRRPAGALGITYLGADFDDPLPAEIQAAFAE
jgi:prevent-host-death family protein